MNRWKRKILSVFMAAVLLVWAIPSVTHAQSTGDVVIAQGVGDAIASNATFFGDLDPSTQVTVDIVLKVQNKSDLQQYINSTVTPGNINFREYMNVSEFKAKYAPNPSQIQLVTQYLNSFGIKSQLYPDNLIITATGTVAQFNKAFSVELQSANLNGQNFHATKKQPRAPQNVAANILCILGLSDYSSYSSNIAKVPDNLKLQSNTGISLDPKDLIDNYDVKPLYQNGANGSGQTIGIVILAEFNPDDAYTFWSQEGINVNQDRIKITDVDGGSGIDGADETTLDVEQSGSLAPGANIDVYVGPNTDPGFIDAFARAINDSISQQISVSWGLSESVIEYFASTGEETPEYAEAFNQLYMQAAAQGISMFAAAGDAGAYDTTRSLGTYELAVDNPADSPYITAAGGTTLPWQGTFRSGATARVEKERAWGWDYLYPVFDSYHLNNPEGYLAYYFVGGGGGFSKEFATPDYQKGVSGVNSFTAVEQWDTSKSKQVGPLLLDAKRLSKPQIVTGTGTGRNLPDISMDADPYTGYNIYFDGEMSSIGGTSIVAPQLAGITALINSHNNTRVGFWNPQIYRFAQSSNSPLHPLNDTGVNNDNIYYTGTAGTIYNQATGLGTPDVAKLAVCFGK